MIAKVMEDGPIDEAMEDGSLVVETNRWRLLVENGHSETEIALRFSVCKFTSKWSFVEKTLDLEDNRTSLSVRTWTRDLSLATELIITTNLSNMTYWSA